MCFLNWTDQGAKAIKDGLSRYEATKGLIAGLGGRLVCGYVTTGQYDVALVVEMPNGDAMTKLAVALTSRGNVRTTTVRAFSPEEFGKRHLDRIVPLRCGGANFGTAAASRGPIRCRRAAHQ